MAFRWSHFRCHFRAPRSRLRVNAATGVGVDANPPGVLPEPRSAATSAANDHVDLDHVDLSASWKLNKQYFLVILIWCMRLVIPSACYESLES